MARGATKALGNVWYEARIRASKFNEKLSSRSGAAELLNMSEDAVKDAELGLSKVMPVDKAVLMSDLYNAPQLINYYCLNECPIGSRHCISDNVLGIDEITVKLIKELRTEDLKMVKDKMLEIAYDGKVSEEEIEELMEVVEYLKDVGKTISELRILGESVAGRK